MSKSPDNSASGWPSLVVPGLVAAAVSAVMIGSFLALWGTFMQPGQAGDAPQKDTAAVTGVEKEAIETTVREYLINNPDILIEMSSALEERQAEAETATRSKALKENAEAIYRSDKDQVVGDPDGDVTVVEFFDYNCGYCKRALDPLMKLIEKDGNVRVVLKEFPIFGKESEEAARAALAAANQGKYFELHRALLEKPGQANMAKAVREAEKLGLDTQQLTRDMNTAEVDAAIAESRRLAEALGVRGTPYYLVGDTAIPGAPDNLYEIFVERVAEIRKNGCDTVETVC